MKLFFSSFILCVVVICNAQPDFSRLDGKITSQEKRAFDQAGVNGSSLVATSADEKYLKINVTSDSMYVASLCLCISEKRIIVLHASAALGRVDYELSEDGKWRSEDQFDWKVRETDMDSVTIQKRTEHLMEHGWVANTLGMGTGQDAEFIVRKDLFRNDSFYLAAGLMPRDNPEKIIPLPAKEAGDCADFSLVAGPPKPEYSFNPKKWYKIRL